MSKHSNTTVAIKREYSAGPIPSPEVLAKYESIKPGITDIILNTYQSQVKHRIEIENKVIENKNRISIKGQVFAFIICLIVIIFGFILILLDKNTIGLVSIISTLIALVSVFIYGKSSEKKERIEKAKIVPEQK